MKMKRMWIGIAALTLARLATAADGAALYQKYCAACHGGEGQGIGTIFPPLANNPRMKDTAYVVKVIKEGITGPLEVAGQRFNGTMAATAGVSDADARAIAEFIKALGSADAQAAPDKTPVAAFIARPEDREHGRALFTGRMAFANGGAPCIACHQAAGTGVLGGGTLATDLTSLSGRLGGPAGVEAVLANPSFPVMRASYAGKPFTDEEKRALAAYLASLEDSRPAGRNGQTTTFWLAGGGGTLGLFGLLALARTTRRPSLAERIRAEREGK